jgi:lipopolysaccharide/colanic/teichoic acid biosynthesis glycosyltransferase
MINDLPRRRGLFVKAAMDPILAAFLLVLATPLMLLAIVMVQAVDPGPVLYRQRREGLHGKGFQVFKLRTMYRNAEQRLEAYLRENPRALAEWEARFKLSDDPRVLPVVGRFLRRFSIDELPQLFNVLRREMSLVGPRPLPDYHLETFPPRFRKLRRQVRPGMTGPWQVSVRSDGDIEAQQVLDSYYVRAWSPWLDLSLLARTLIAVIRSKGAY